MRTEKRNRPGYMAARTPGAGFCEATLGADVAARTLLPRSSKSERQNGGIQVNSEKRFSGAIARLRLLPAVTVSACARPACVAASLLLTCFSVITPAVEVQP